MTSPTYRVVNRVGDFERISMLELYWEVAGDPISDNYLPSEISEDDRISAADLWAMWVDYEIDRPATRWGTLEHLPIEWQRITWTVQGTDAGIFEFAPHQEKQWADQEDFLTHYFEPQDTQTRVRVQWPRLPVVDKLWRPGRGDKGGFIQEATGWKPAPFQPFVNVRQLATLAGLYYPSETE